MAKKQLSPKYDHHQVEQGKYQFWLDQDYFKADPTSKKPKFSIILPPPNVTGKLHIGHALDAMIQDALVRYKKLQGYDTVFIPGMDHAGISTQVKVEAKLKADGIDKATLSRAAFLKYAWSWKEEYATIIREQWAKLGLGFDYSLEKFTLDTDVAKLVTQIFVDFYNKGLIYKGKKIVNWDPQQQTAISNVEVIYREVAGEMFYFKYFLADQSDYLLVATTRPETMFADQCVVVNPNDQRYQKWIGHKVINPVNQQLIPVISDDYVDVAFGTGVMKCTPAHDPNDFEIALRHDLAKPLCMHEDGTINALGGELYSGLDRFAARSKIIHECQAAKTLTKIEPIMHQVGFSERSGVVVEPYLSDQWFVKMASFGKMIVDLQTSKQAIKFFPKRFNDVLLRWMENVHDWTISRQLWWGHQIPAWYHKADKTKIYVGVQPPQDAENWIQDPDVLDTWFSSGLWPFAVTMREQGAQSLYFKNYFPISVMVTGFDIIFFWVARMIFQTKEYTNQIPFQDVLIHGLIRAADGQKMSKSLGNGVDPIALIDQHGADALRFFLLNGTTPGQDIKYSDAKLSASWNFINKLWNAARYVLMNVDEHFTVQPHFWTTMHLNQTDQWILTEFSKTKAQVTELIEKYEFALALKVLYDFVWNTYCSWYLELSKVNLQNPASQPATSQTLVYVLKNVLVMLHPFLPFVTEHIYQQLDQKASILVEQWSQDSFTYSTDYVNTVLHLTTAIREFRTLNKIANKKALIFNLAGLSQHKHTMITHNLVMINEFLHDLVNAKIQINTSTTSAKTVLPIEDFVLEIANAAFIDQVEMRKQMLAQQSHLRDELKRSEGLLNNSNFMSKASADKIAVEKAKYDEYKHQLELLENQLINH